MKLKRFLLRYYPPGAEKVFGPWFMPCSMTETAVEMLLENSIILEYIQSGELKTKSIDLLDLNTATDVEALVEDIRKAEPLITQSRKDQVVHLILRLQEKLRLQVDHKFYPFKCQYKETK